MRIVFSTTCKNRTWYLRQTLPKNLADNPRSTFLVLDYNSEDDLVPYLKAEHGADIRSGRLMVYTCREWPVFRMAHAKNMAHRCAMREGAEVLVTLDADNYAGLGFEDYVENKFNTIPGLSFICPDFSTLPPPGHRFNAANPVRLGRGFAGRLAIRSQDFAKLGGYNESFDTWRGEDMDFIARADRLGLVKSHIDPVYLNAINHSSDVRFREYPHAQQFENDDIYRVIREAHDTVVNYGRWGCGTVYRNFATGPIGVFPLPTRVFGVGMQRTGTTSLYEAFKILGMDSGHWESGEWARAIWWEMNRWGRSATLERCYALCDNPMPLLYRKLDEAYPGSKFVLTVRDEESWLRSVERFWTTEGNPRRWTWDVDGFSHRCHAMVYGRTDFDAEAMLSAYRRHNADVIDYFRDRPDDLLVMDMGAGAGWSELCGFLGVGCPSEPYPMADGTKTGNNRGK